MPEDLLVELSERPDAATLGGEKSKVIALVADIRGIAAPGLRSAHRTRFSLLLNNVFGPLGATVERYGGSVEAIDGDSLTALFGLPVHKADDAERATACGVAMQLAMPEINARNRRGGLPEIAIGVGIASGGVLDRWDRQWRGTPFHGAGISADSRVEDRANRAARAKFWPARRPVKVAGEILDVGRIA